MMKRISYRSIFLVFSIFLIFARPLSAEKAGIRDLLVTNNASDVLVYARVMNCFTKDIEAAILAGVPTTFTFVVDLFQQRSWWLDGKVTRVTIKHTLKYDNVKKLFQVSFDGDKEPTTSFPDFEGAKRVMADLNGIPVAQLKALKRNKYYYVQIKAKLDKVRLPLHMEYVFFFVSLWDFETDWEREGFFY
jgi:hypothetical protein